jgi:hypothetical protein
MHINNEQKEALKWVGIFFGGLFYLILLAILMLFILWDMRID